MRAQKLLQALGQLSLAVLIASCGTAAENVTVCWGDGSDGKLGDGQGDPFSSSYKSYLPVEVAGGHSFAMVCTGYYHSCALEPSGVAWCWGDGATWGQLGAGSSDVISNAPVAVAGNHAFRSITCGERHTCALDGDGQAYCWGHGGFGQLGIGNLDNADVPTIAAEGRTFAAISAGAHHTCGLEKDAGRALCWGENIDGQLGAALDADMSLTPVEVAGGRTFSSISAGAGYHTCALEPPPSSRAWCWGNNGYGRLGNGETGVKASQRSPVPVSGNHAFAVISVGARHTCAISTDNQAWCWGEQIANGQDKHTNTPTAVGGGHAFLTVSAAFAYTCALDASKAVYCWGNAGTLPPVPVKVDSSNPVKVDTSVSFSFLGDSGGDHVCGIGTKQAIPAQSPSPFSARSPSTSLSPSPTATSSSVPIGAIAGGVGGAAVLAAILAFFALRPGKGWLRRKPVPATLEDGSYGKATPTNESSSASDSQPNGNLSSSQAQKAPSDKDVSQLSRPPAAAAGSVLEPDTLLPRGNSGVGSLPGPDTFLPYGSVAEPVPTALVATAREPSPGLDTILPNDVTPAEPAPTAPAAPHVNSGNITGPSTGPQPIPDPLPLSYITTAGLGVAASPAVAYPWALGQAASGSRSSAYSPDSDHVLSFISSYLSNPSLASAQQRQPPSLASGGSGGSGAIELRTEARLWEVQWQELGIVRLIGHGSFGSVYLAEWNQTQVAVKVLVGRDNVNRGQLELPDKVARELHAEAAVMSHMRHPNIVQFMGLVALPPALITEYCSHGSLYECLSAARQCAPAAAQLTWRRRLSMAVDAATGLLYLHRRSIIHRDVKSPNLLVDEAWRVKVADFNLSKLLEGAGPENSLSTAGGVTNPLWLAPEVMDGEKPVAASDVYSFGMVLYELLTWRLPWNLAEVSPFKIMATIRQGGRPEVPPREALPGPQTAGWAGLDGYVQLMRDCWAQLPGDRPSFDEVVGRLRQLLDGAPAS